MRLSHIKKQDVLAAAALLDSQGNQGQSLKDNYHVMVGGRPYPFKTLVREANHAAGYARPDFKFPSDVSTRR